MLSFRAIAPVFISLLLAACSGAPTAATTLTLANGHVLTGTDLNGNRHDLGQDLAQGNWVALVFWQDWCKSCLAEAPQVQAASKIYRERVQFYGVVSGPELTEDDFGLREKVHELGLTYPQLRDFDGSISCFYRVTSTPTILVFASDGSLRYRGSKLPERWDSLLAQ